MKELPLSFADDRTAKQLARLAKCSIPTVYRRIQALKDLGAVISESRVPGKQTGPVPLRYRLVKAP
jgi:hypothetical protein